MQGRLFTFGGSTTEFTWPTWADILGREFDQFENWGKNGSGNSYQMYSLAECHKRNSIDKHDTVIILWVSIDRDDRWKDGEWQSHGGVFNGYEPFNGNYIKKFADPFGYLIRDLAVISATKQLLDNIGCRWYFLSTVPLDYHDLSFPIEDARHDIDSRALELYKNDIAFIKPSIYEIIFNNDWFSRPGYRDMEYFKDSYSNLSGSSWPSFDDFASFNFSQVEESIVKEIDKSFHLDKIKNRTDPHPTPIEYLEYLDLVLPEITVSDQTRQWTLEQNKRVLDLDPYYANMFRGQWKTNIPKERF